MKRDVLKKTLLLTAISICICVFSPAVQAVVASDHAGKNPGNLTVQMPARNVNTGLHQKDEAAVKPSPALTPRHRDVERVSPIGLVFFKAQNAASTALKRMDNIYSNRGDNQHDRAELLRRLSDGKGIPRLLWTLFIVALIIASGLIVEWLFRRATEDIRRGILEIAPMGRFQKFGRVLSRVFLDALGIGAYILTTFLLFVLIYEKREAGFVIASVSLVGSYYVMFFLFAAKLICSPVAPSLRLLPLEDQDAVFLYRWMVLITLVASVIAVASGIFRNLGVPIQQAQLLYSTAGIAIVLLLIVMILQSRERVARAICEDTGDGTGNTSPLLDKFARTWHVFAILYVVGVGVYWHAGVLIEGKGNVVNLLISIFLIPVFIGIDQWGQKLLKIASGELPETIDLSGIDAETAAGDATAAIDAEIAAQAQGSAKKRDIKHFVPFIRRSFRFLLTAFLFFSLLQLWGIDLPLGRILTSHALSIIVVILLGLITWELAKAWIDRRIQDEMPDTGGHTDDGWGAGGSRIGTLLVLLRKFIFTVLFIVVSLIILSAIGVNIGPLIAGAGVIGLAIGFGAQTLVKDIIAGVFYLIDDAFRSGDFIETAGMKGMVEQISLRSLRLRHPRGQIHTIPFGHMGTVTNLSRDYAITKLEFRVRYDTDIDMVRKAVKKINAEIQQDAEVAAGLLSPIKSQGVREMDDSAMIMRVKFTTIPGKQFVVRREVYRLLQEKFKQLGIEFAHRNVTVFLPEDTKPKKQEDAQTNEAPPMDTPEQKLTEVAAAAAIAVLQAEEDAKKPA